MNDCMTYWMLDTGYLMLDTGYVRIERRQGIRARFSLHHATFCFVFTSYFHIHDIIILQIYVFMSMKKAGKMNTLFLKIAVILLLVIVAGCEKENERETAKGESEGYIVGSFTCYEIDGNGQATGQQTDRGYCILLSGKIEYHWQKPMDFYTFDIQDNLFDFPKGIILPGSDGGNCGPRFFPDSLRNTFKIKFNYRPLNFKEKIEFVCGPCTAMEAGFPWDNFDQVRISDITKY
jgi:hypothetical protein